MEKIKQNVKNNSTIKKWLPLIVLSSALMIIIIDTTVLNVSIRDILTDLETNVTAIQWVISAYALTLAALTVTGGRLGDLFGRKKMFRVGAVLFAIGSLITSFAPNIAWVIFGNAIVEGIGAALMMPATASLLITSYKGKDRAVAFAIWGSVAATAAAIGPILGGFLTTNYSWRWAFRINLVVVVLLLIGSKFIKEAINRSEKRELDFVGVFLSSIGLTSIVYGLIESSKYGWWKATSNLEVFGNAFAPLGLSITPITIVAGLLLLTIFSVFEHKREKAGHTPLVSLKLFKNKQFTAGSVTTGLLAVGQSGLIFAVPIFYQSVLKLDALHTGIGLVPMSLAIMISAPTALKLIKWFTPKQIIQLGFIISTIGAGIIYSTLSLDATTLSLAPGLFVYGFGLGFGFSQLSNLTLSAVSAQQSGEASGVNNTIRQIGGSFGSAIIGAALIATLTTNVVKNIESSPIIPDNQRTQIIESVKAAGSNIEFVGPIALNNQTAETTKEIELSTNKATVDGNKIAILLTGASSLIALAFSTLLPNIRDLETGDSPKAAH